jgi:CRISPR-associated endoribonuclease Cas6
MPSLCCLQLTPDADLLLPDCGGVELHGIFFSLLAEVDPDLATRVHDKPGQKPYALGGLRGGTLGGGRLLLRAGERATFKLGLLTEELVHAWEELLAGLGEGKKVSLGRGAVTVSVSGKPYYQDWRRLPPARPWKTFNLRLATPLAFKSGRVNLPLPEPQLLINSLSRRWAEFADAPLELPEGAAERVKLGRYELRTELRRLGRNYFVGAVGGLSLELPRTGRRELAALLRLAEFCGAGSKTTMGMGEIAIIRKPRSER